MSKLRKTTRRATTEEHRLEVDKALLLEALRAFGHHNIPAYAKIFVRVPGGGDWSNTNLHIDEDGVLHVCWSQVEYHPVESEELEV